MRDLRLAYLVFEVSALAEWRRFLVDIVGACVEAENDRLFARLDACDRRLILSQGAADDLMYCGWEAPDRESFAEQVEALHALQVATAVGTPEECELRAVERLVRFKDPDGLTHEVCLHPRSAQAPALPLLGRGFVTGAAGLGHVVMLVSDLRASDDFHRAALRARLSDRIETTMLGLPVKIAFLHTNARHHSLALAHLPLKIPKRLQHFMLEYAALEDVGLALDRAKAAGVPITHDLGQHPNDRMLSFYCRTPSGFELELGWGGACIDDTTWSPTVYDRLSIWGHQAATAPAAQAATR